MDIQRLIQIILFFFIFSLIGFGFSLLTTIPLIQRFLLRSRESRVAGLLFLAMLSFLTGLLFTSRSLAELWFLISEDYLNYPYLTTFLSIDWDWVFQNRSRIINEFWIESLIPTLSEGTCFSSDPKVCNFAGWMGGHSLGFVPILNVLALIPAFITLGRGWRYLRDKYPKRSNPIRGCRPGGSRSLVLEHLLTDGL